MRECLYHKKASPEARNSKSLPLIKASYISRKTNTRRKSIPSCNGRKSRTVSSEQVPHTECICTDWIPERAFRVSSYPNLCVCRTMRLQHSESESAAVESVHVQEPCRRRGSITYSWGIFLLYRSISVGKRTDGESCRTVGPFGWTDTAVVVAAAVVDAGLRFFVPAHPILNDRPTTVPP